MTEIIAFPDAEALAIAYLTERLGVPVSTKVPNPRPNEFVKVTRVGGSKVRLNADSATLVFECWGATTISASDLGRMARAYVHAMPGNDVNGKWVYKVTEVGGLAFFPDPNTDLPRYQFTVSIDLKGEAL